MPIQLTPDGLQIQTADQILAELDQAIDDSPALGPDVNTAIDSPLGQLLRRLASREADLQQEIESLVLSLDPNTAEGAQLDVIGRLNGVARQGARASVSTNATANGSNGTVLSGTLLVRNNRTLEDWQLTNTPTTIGVLGTALIELTSRETGPKEFIASDTWTILTPVAGWTSLTTTDIDPDEIGRDLESDADYDERRKLALLSEGNDFDAILAAVAQLDGVQYTGGYNNRDCENTVQGVPPGAIEVVVDGGDAIDIARTIYDRLPPGTQTFGGNVTVTTDLAGNSVPISFTRPSDVPLYLRATVNTVNAEYDLPQNAEDLIAESVLSDANELFTDVGVDCLAGALESCIWKVLKEPRFGRPTVSSVTVEVSDDNASWSTSYAIDHKQKGDFDSTRVTVVVL